ncbi:ADP,ATP carrier protein 1 [Astathelohania contejeani]|uniref:ADP,ATP carrier protein n=1 Tax=Astathelohania contejeani TaxID=164912 RepID=A0ABQ7I0F1_9MICR|nr:ADP,ATP carrier protein 1 [Thelohania contejeani]
MESESMNNYDRLPRESEIEAEANTPGIFGRIIRIAKIERPKFCCLAAMFFFIALVYSLMRDLKDSFVIEKQGAAAIAFLKTVFITPASIISVLIIQKALNKYTTSQIFRVVTMIFGVYFIFYGVILIRLGEYFEPDKFWASDRFGEGKMGLRKLEFLYSPILTINAWTASLLYISSELWGNLVLSLLFLSYSNEICPPKQSLRFTPLYFIVSNIGLIISGCFIYFMTIFKETQSYRNYQYLQQGLFIIAGISCVAILLLHYYLEKSILSKPLYIVESATKKKKSKAKVGFVEGLIEMSYSKVLLAMCGIVFFYFVGYNIGETSYKAAVSAFSSKENKAASTVILRNAAINQILIGLAVIFFLITPLTRVIEKGFWFVIALLPLIAVGGLGLVILAFATLNTAVNPKGKNIKWISNIIKSMGYTEKLNFEVTIGRIGSALFKITKYAAFDVCKEAISVKISSDIRPKAKGIYDGIVGKLGKSGSSIVINILYAIYDTKDPRDTSVPLFIFSLLGSVIWFIAIIYLNKKYNEAVNSNSDIDLGMKKGYEIK